MKKFANVSQTYDVNLIFKFDICNFNISVSDDEQVDYTNDDCLMVVVLTHGWDGGILYAKDGPYMASELWNPFTPDKCKTLAGKPKLFIIQVHILLISCQLILL